MKLSNHICLNTLSCPSRSRSGVPHQITRLSGTFKALWKSAVTEQYTCSWSWLIQAGAEPQNVKAACSVNPLKPREWNCRAACQVPSTDGLMHGPLLIRKFVLTNLSGHVVDAATSPCLSWWLCLLIATPEADSVPPAISLKDVYSGSDLIRIVKKGVRLKPEIGNAFLLKAMISVWWLCLLWGLAIEPAGSWGEMGCG